MRGIRIGSVKRAEWERLHGNTMRNRDYPSSCPLLYFPPLAINYLGPDLGV